MNDKVIVSVAPVSAAAAETRPPEIAREVAECFRAGAGMVHLHCRDAQGRLTADTALLQETVLEIKRLCPIVIEISTGGVSNLTIRERCAPCAPGWVECNSLNVGSVNLGESVYQNPIGDVRYCVEQILKNRKIPEIEVFEVGMLNTARVLAEEFPFPKPLLFSLVLGHFGAMPATPAALRAMIDGVRENFPQSADALWGITQAHRRDWTLIETALELGARTVRVGFEDSAYLDPDTVVPNNAPLVARCAELVRANGKAPATPGEVRRMLGIPA
jgi:3-keto-5-aminohexanoate cleavage enzyme